MATNLVSHQYIKKKKKKMGRRKSAYVQGDTVTIYVAPVSAWCPGGGVISVDSKKKRYYGRSNIFFRVKLIRTETNLVNYRSSEEKIQVLFNSKREGAVPIPS